MTTKTFTWSIPVENFRGKHGFNTLPERFDSACIKMSPPETPPIEATLFLLFDSFDVTFEGES